MIECILCLSIMATLLMGVVLGYQHWIAKNQLITLVNNTIGALQFARLTAMTSHATLTFCAMGHAGKCGEDWQQGQWIINTKTGLILRQLPSLPPAYYFQWKSTLGESHALQWRASGFTRGQQGSFLICARQPKMASAQIIILRTGRLRSVMGKIAACDDLRKRS